MRFRFTLNNSIEGQEVLSREPKGWDKTEILIKRDQKYHGLFREFSVKLEFHSGAGKEYIDEIYHTQGIDAEVTILIELECDGTYETLYSGKLNLETWESFGNIGSRDSFTSVDIIEIGITQTVKNRLKTKINLSELATLDGTALTDFNYGPYDLNLHSKVITRRSLLTTVAAAPQYTEFTLVAPGGATEVWAELPFDSLTYDELVDALIPAAPYVSTSVNGLFPEAVYTNTSGESITVTLDYSFIGSVIESEDNDRTYTLYLKYRKGLGGFAASTPTTLASYGAKSELANIAMTQAVNSTGSINFTLADTESLYFYFEFENYDGTVAIEPFVRMSFTTCEINFSSETTTPATTAKVFAIHEAGARIAQSITNQTDAFRSDYFGRTNSQPNIYASNGCASFGAITNGFQIRKFPISDRPIYISMEDFYEGLDSIYNLGMGIEVGGSGYVIRIEPKEYFYSASVVLRIGNIPDIKVGVARDYYYNSLQVGYEKWETEQVNGLEEFNAKRHYSLPISSNKELVKLSKLVAGGYPLETARRKLYVDETTTDYTYDNENFIICLSRELSAGNPILNVAEKNENYTANVNNVLSPSTAYNLRISPARNALRWNNVVSAGLLKRPGTNLKLVYSEGNGLMESEFTSDTCEGNYNNEVLIENQDIQFDGVNTNNLPIWIPEIYEFDFPLSFTDYKNIKANPTYCLEISRTNTDFVKAYILEIRYKPVSGMASFKLLRANA